MFVYDKKLQYPVKIDKPNPRLASVIISQYGGPDGELGASLRYLSQRYSMPFDEPKDTGWRQFDKPVPACYDVTVFSGPPTERMTTFADHRFSYTYLSGCHCR